MAESMLQIFQRHRDCYDTTKEPNWQESDEARQLCYERQREREQAAHEYVSNILASNDNWAKDVDEDVSKLALSFQRILNKAEREAYREATAEFLQYVATELREHRVKQLSPVTRYRMGRMDFPAMNVVTGLSHDEAAREYQRLKEQGFTHVQTFPTEAFPAVYTALGYKPKASTPAQAQNEADSGTKGKGMGNNTSANPETPPAAKETANEWLSGKPKEVLDEAVKCGLAELKDDAYYWILGDQEKGWQVGLYGYFVLMVSEQLGWRTGKAKRIGWKKFQKVFRNHEKILATAKQTVDAFKKGTKVPFHYYKVDNLIKNVFGVELAPTIKSL